MKRERLREGFTTGSAAAAASKAALHLLLGGLPVSSITVPRPPFHPMPEQSEESWSHAATEAIQSAFFSLADNQSEESQTFVVLPWRTAPLQSDQPSAGQSRLTIPIADVSGSSISSACNWQSRCELPCATASVIKDGGDDPDATHGIAIEASVRIIPIPEKHLPESSASNTGCMGILLSGGTGVGTVTLRGLPVSAGEPAINPEPRKQIAAALFEALHEALTIQREPKSGEATAIRLPAAYALHVTITVPQGMERARRTMNPRLGIIGGISILGTRGTVKPFSHSSWKATIEQGMDVALAAGLDEIGITTGRRSERMLMEKRPHLPETGFVQAADFVQFSLQAAARKNFRKITWGCFVGKLVKMAQGHAYTHARTAPIDFAGLAKWCVEHGMPESLLPDVAGANTAREVVELLSTHPDCPVDRIMKGLAGRAKQVAEHWIAQGVAQSPELALEQITEQGQKPEQDQTLPPTVTLYCFDFDGKLLANV